MKLYDQEVKQNMVTAYRKYLFIIRISFILQVQWGAIGDSVGSGHVPYPFDTDICQHYHYSISYNKQIPKNHWLIIIFINNKIEYFILIYNKSDYK